MIGFYFLCNCSYVAVLNTKLIIIGTAFFILLAHRLVPEGLEFCKRLF